MDRRRFLALCGTSASLLAGCAANPIDSGSSPTPSGPTDTPLDIDPLEGSWTSYRNDAGNTAATTDPGPTAEPETLWRRSTTTGRPVAGPTAADGAFVVVTDTGVVYAREASDGAIRWSRPQPVDTTVAPVASGDTAAVADGRTLRGLRVDSGEERWTVSLDAPVTGLATAADAIVVATESAVRMVAPDDGAELWHYSVGGSVVTPPGAGDGIVAVGLDSRDVLALDAEAREQRWRTGVGVTPTFAPAVGDGTVYAEAGSRVVALDGTTGDQQWDRNTDDPVATSPVRTADALYVTTIDTDVAPPSSGGGGSGGTGTATPYATDTEGFEATLLALSPADGGEQWRVEERDTYNFTSGPPEHVPVIATADLVIVGLGGQLGAYDVATGDHEWSAPATAVTPAVWDDVVSTGTIGIDATDGSVRWRLRIGESIDGAPAVVDNTVYVGSDDNYLYALAANEGTVEWAARTDDLIRTAPAVGDGAVYVGTINGSLYAFERADGTERWRVPVGGQVKSPAYRDGTVYVGTFSEDLYAIDVADGSERWHTEIEGERAFAHVVAVDDEAVYTGTNGDLRAFDASDGAERWRVTTDRRVVQSPPVAADGRVFVNMGNDLLALDASDGTEVWRKATGGSNEPPAVEDGTVYTPGDDAVYAFDAADGTRQWQRTVTESVDLAVGEETVYGVGYGTPIVAFDTSDGRERWRSTDVGATTAPAIAGEYLFVGDETGTVHALGPRPE